MSIKEIISGLETSSEKQVKKYAASGKKVIGWTGPYAPIELVMAFDMVPIGVWGKNGEVTGAKEYFPAFYTSIVLRTMDMGLAGELDELSGMIISDLSDGLKGLSQNWKIAVKKVPMLYLGYGQNRKIDAGIEYNRIQHQKLVENLEKISGKKFDPAKAKEAIVLTNKHRKAMTEFTDLAAKHLNTVTAALRGKVFASALVYDIKEHLEIMEKINAELKSMPEEKFDGKKIVVTGVLVDDKDILSIIDDNKLGIVDDNTVAESCQYDTLVSESESDPMKALSQQIADIEGNMFLFDEKKLRGKIIADKVKAKGADGVLYVMTKFCESDEFDYPIVRDDLNKAKIKNVRIEIDQQMNNFEQARTAIETFKDIL